MFLSACVNEAHCTLQPLRCELSSPQGIQQSVRPVCRECVRLYGFAPRAADIEAAVRFSCRRSSKKTTLRGAVTLRSDPVMLSKRRFCRPGAEKSLFRKRRYSIVRALFFFFGLNCCNRAPPVGGLLRTKEFCFFCSTC